VAILEDGDFARAVDPFRGEVTAHCYRMLGSLADAEDAVQETLIRAWKSWAGFEPQNDDPHRSMRAWLYKIATNRCLTFLARARRRELPTAMTPEAAAAQEVLWLEPLPDSRMAYADRLDPAARVVARESVELAFVVALQELPPRQRAVLILREVLRWEASEVAELLDTTVASVNSALQRARATLHKVAPEATSPRPPLSDADRALLERYVRAFERYDLTALTDLIREDATQSMPPYDMWLAGRDDIFAWWLGPGIGCRGSRVIPVGTANGSPAFGQYKPGPGGGYEPWALQVLELEGGRIGELTFFLDTERLFPLFGLPFQLA
jgi:RNA polymerase sigma-70 factor (ECF subfamily)